MTELISGTEAESRPLLALPHLYHPFATPVHPDFERAEQDLLTWLEGHRLLENPGWSKGLRHGKVGEYCSRVYSDATYEGLLIASCAYAWIYCIDDGFCGLHGMARTPGELAAVNLWLYELIADPAGHDPAPLREELGARHPAQMADFLLTMQESGWDLCRRIAAISTPAQYARWTAGMMTFLFSVLWEAGRFASNVIPGTSEYLSGRTYTGNAEGAFSLLDIAAGHEVPEEIYHDADVARLRRIIGLILCLTNDIFSYPKEAGESCGNLVGVLTHNRGLSPQAALDESVAIHNQYMERYLTLEAEVRERIDHPALSRLLDEARSYIRGNYDWHFVSPRYQAARNYDLSQALRPGEISASRRQP